MSRYQLDPVVWCGIALAAITVALHLTLAAIGA